MGARNSNCICIGLTGGIASGKTAVSDLFTNFTNDVIDTDIIAREVVAANSKGLNQLICAFGKGILNQSGLLNRSKLREIVFNQSSQLERLNSILHPLISNLMFEKIKKVEENYCVIVIPLLRDKIKYHWLDRILVVDVSADTQLSRLSRRDNITTELAKKMMSSQCSRSQRLKIADDVINNEQPQHFLQQQVKSLHHLYKSL